MFGRATIRLGIGPHSSSYVFYSAVSTAYKCVAGWCLSIGCLSTGGTIVTLSVSVVSSEGGGK